MYRPTGFLRLVGMFAGLASLLAATERVAAQSALEDFPTGAAAEAWALWHPAMQAILDRNTQRAEELFSRLLAADPSALRIALLADRTERRTPLGGALLLLQQDYENQALDASGQRIVELLEAGTEQKNQADDGWYFCALGRFDVAQANFLALLASQPDPVALLEFTDEVPRRREMLLQLTDHELVGPAVREILALLDRGEELIKADPTRIKTSIERLGGPPRAYENAVALLKQSGEYAIPFIVEALRDPERRELTRPILGCLPQIGRPALNPLVYAIRVDRPVVRCYLIEALGQIGYPQALPYLLQLREQVDLPERVRNSVESALSALARRSTAVDTSISAAEAFYRLAVAYYEDARSLAADPRLDTANVWYWRDDLLQNVEVPTPIFNEIMCMRCCEEALRLDPNLRAAQALWVAANFRREAQLPEGQVDRTRPPNYPSAKYFAQTAGPAVCLMALARALDDGDPAVALGVIEALRNTAGPASLVGDAGGRLPLAEALSFPDRMVRIRAALTLGNARPTQPFHNYQNLMPVLSEALRLHVGARSALVVDPDTDSVNRIAGWLREDGYEVVSDAEFFRGLQKVREQFPALDLIVLASTLPDTALAAALTQLRSEFRFAATPVLIITKPGDRNMVEDLVRPDHRLAQLPATAGAEHLRAAAASVSRAVGITPITPEVGTAIAMETAQTLHLLAVTANPLFDVGDARPALITALATADPELRLAVGQVLAYVCEPAAQEALAGIALNEQMPEQTRVEFFAVLAESAKLCGCRLGDASVRRIISLAESAENMVIRTAASHALGALNLPADTGSEIIRNQYSG